MNILKSIVLGIVEGITEWIPVSSTAHLKIFNKILALDVTPEFYDVFEVVIQLGAILALVVIFWNKIWPFGKSKHPLGNGILAYVKKTRIILWLKIAVACIPVILYKLFVDDYVNFINEDNEMLFIAIALIVVGIVFIVVELLMRNKKPTIEKTREITFLNALIIGLSQLVAAVFPGVSRSGATIITSLLMGMSRTIATQFTFQLAIPVMFGASLMEVIKFDALLSFSEILILFVGCAAAFIVSLFVIKFILNYIKNHSFTIFGIYRILLGIIIFIFLI